MLLPCTNSTMRAEASQRQGIICKSGDYLSVDVEQDMARLFKSEIIMHRECEEVAQQLESMMEYSEEGCFATLDPGNLGFLEIKTVDSFFKRTFTKGITLEDNAAIIRRLDQDGDNKLKFDEFIAGIRA